MRRDISFRLFNLSASREECIDNYKFYLFSNERLIHFDVCTYNLTERNFPISFPQRCRWIEDTSMRVLMELGL